MEHVNGTKQIYRSKIYEWLNWRHEISFDEENSTFGFCGLKNRKDMSINSIKC